MQCSKCHGKRIPCTLCRGWRIIIGPCRTPGEVSRQTLAIMMIGTPPWVEDGEEQE